MPLAELRAPYRSTFASCLQRWRAAGAAALLAALAGCETAPVAPAPAPRAVAPSPRASAPEARAAGLPYSAAVAARFPEPAVSYRSPAFAPGRTAFTTDAEIRASLRTLAGSDASPAAGVRLLVAGTSQRGVPIEALWFGREAEPAAAAGSAAAPPRPTVLLIGQQHGDEPAGSEALLVIAQQLAQGRLQPLLERINVIVLPRANPDGAALGQRASASGIDINRDHLLLRTPEALALAALMREHRPMVVVDAHEYTVVGRWLDKFGAIQRYDALLQHAMTANLPPFITRAADEWFRAPLQERLGAEGLSTQWYYTTSNDLADKKVAMGGVQPDTGRNVNGLKNAVSLLVESRGVGIGRTHFARRVHTQVAALSSVLQSAADRAGDLAKLRVYVDREVAAQACRGEAVLEAAATPSEFALEMLDPVTGVDKTVTVAWDSALTLRTVKARARPCGYWLDAEQADAVRRLRALGVQVQQITTRASVRGEVYRETARAGTQRQDVRGALAEAGGAVALKVELQPQPVELRPGSFYVGLDQPLGNLVVAALEPDTQNSYAANRIVTTTDAVARVLARPSPKAWR